MNPNPKNGAMRQTFVKFHEACKDTPKIFSVVQAAKEIGADHKKLRRWAKSKDGYESDDFFLMCAMDCGIKIGAAVNNKDMTVEEAEKHLLENGFDLNRLKPFQQEAKRIAELLEWKKNLDKNIATKHD